VADLHRLRLLVNAGGRAGPRGRLWRCTRGRRLQGPETGLAALVRNLPSHLPTHAP